MLKPAVIALTCFTGLVACQAPTQVIHPITTSSAHSLLLKLNKTTVHSWHLGRNASGERYLLIVLNHATVDRLRTETPHSLQLMLADQTFTNTMPVQGGFLVLHPLPTSWDELKISKLLSS